MNIETELFNKYEVDLNKLIKYGFKKENELYKYQKNILDNKFTIIIEFNKKIKGKIIENEFKEEYINFRRETIGEFNAKIKEEFINLLIDIRNNCFIKNDFIFSQTKRINEYITNKYKTNLEFLWDKYPSFGVFKKTNKWFALIGNISLNKINKELSSNQEIEFINLKVSKDIISNLLSKKGYYEAYHMNKKNWITIILDDTLSDNIIKNLIDDSFNII